MRAAGVVLAVVLVVVLASCDSQDPNGGGSESSMQVFRIFLEVMMCLINTIVQALVMSAR